MAPLLPATALLHAVLKREDNTGIASSCDDIDVPCLDVVCAWPLSGQYGFGQRILYYIIVVVCVVARKAEWIRDVFLAAALLVPAVAAVHGIVLASLHDRDAIDMDIYGALQFCSIGILAAPVTVKTSSTFFHNPGRNIIFLWTGLILSGLLSLAVEFYRSNTHPCVEADLGSPIPSSPRDFPYQQGDICNLICSQDNGPSSPLRQGAASEIYVVPSPATLPFGMAMFLAAAECVPAILSLVSMWNKILEFNWKARRSGTSLEKERSDDLEVIPGTNGATFGSMKAVNQAIRSLLKAVEVPVFGGAWLAVLIIGEINFWSSQVNYHTESIGSIGQWGTILGTGMAGLGSLYFWSAKKINGNGESNSGTSIPHREAQDRRPGSEGETSTPSSDGDWEARRKIANLLGKVGNYFGNPSKDPFWAGDFNTGEWPRIPGEASNRQMAYYDETHSIIDVESRRSRDDGSGSDVGSATRPGSPTSPSSFSRRALTPRRHAHTMPSRHSSFEQARPDASSSNDPRAKDCSRMRRATLEVPPSAHHRC